jgi:hypothetical protein
MLSSRGRALLQTKVRFLCSTQLHDQNQLIDYQTGKTEVSGVAEEPEYLGATQDATTTVQGTPLRLTLRTEMPSRLSILQKERATLKRWNS